MGFVIFLVLFVAASVFLYRQSMRLSQEMSLRRHRERYPDSPLGYMKPKDVFDKRGRVRTNGPLQT